MTYAVEFQNVSRLYGDVRAVDGVSIGIRDGEFFSMLGPSGSGKTTCLRLIAGFEQLSGGTIHIFGHPASNAEALEDILVRNEVQGKLYVCHTTELPDVSTRPLRDMVGDCWDLSEVMAGYEKFIPVTLYLF